METNVDAAPTLGLDPSLFATTALDQRNQRYQRFVQRIFLGMTLLLILPVILILGVLVTQGRAGPVGGTSSSPSRPRE